MKHDNFLNLDMHRPHERCLVQVGLDGLTPPQLDWLFSLFQEAKEGREIQFGADTLEGGSIVMKFTLVAKAHEITLAA